MQHREFQWLAGDGLSLYGQTWFPQEAPRGVIALVHGLGEHSGRYRKWAEQFTGCGMAIVALDLRGHGRSGGKRGHASYDVLMQDIDLLIEKAASLAPGTPVVLYGHSLGGALVLYYLMKRKPKIAAAVVTSPGLATATDPGAVVVVGRLLSRIMPAFTLPNGLDRSGLARDPEVERLYSADPLVHDRISAGLGIDLIEAGKWIQTQAPNLPEIPVLLMQGTADRIVSRTAVEEFASRAGPQVTYKPWPDYYHELHNEPTRDEVLNFIVEWLENVL